MLVVVPEAKGVERLCNHVPNTGEGASRHHVGDALSTRLETAANTEDGSSDEDGQLSAELVAASSGKACADELASGEDLAQQMSVLQRARRGQQESSNSPTPRLLCSCHVSRGLALNRKARAYT